MEEEIINLIQINSPDGGFLQSEKWRKFQEAVGWKTFNISGEGFWANIIEHKLPMVGKYFYIPRGTVISISNFQFSISNQVPNSNESIKENIREIINLAKKNNVGWIRFDPLDGRITDLIHELITELKIKKAPHDMQPRELFIIDITKSEEQLLAEMKSKTRYNIKLAQKHNVKVSADQKYIDNFIRLVKITAKRDGITPHPDEYYRKMFEAIPAENIKLYLAEYENKIVAANIIIFFGKTATYLHGASDHSYKNLMAPHLLQWQAMLDAKAAGCERYDFGGIKTESNNSWVGITRFKTGFSTVTQSVQLPGSFDIVLNPFKYNLYRILQSIKALF